jgi:mono/diheme cytochrome c family protein
VTRAVRRGSLAAGGLCGVLLMAGAIAWAAEPAEPAQLALGEALFSTATPACAVCHALQAVGSEAEVGPNLDELKPDAERVERALRNGVGNMPSYRSTLTEEQIRALAAFVARSTGGAP